MRRQTVFGIQDILRQVHRMTQNEETPTKSKVPYVFIVDIPESQFLLGFTLLPTVFESLDILRIVHRMTPNDHEPYKAKGTPHVLLVLLSPRFQSVWLYDQRFRTFYKSALTTMWNGKRRTTKSCQKFIILNFTILLPTLVEILHTSIHEFWGANLMYTFRGYVVWYFYSHIVPVNQKEKKKKEKLAKI